MIGLQRGKYSLARIGDEGAYHDFNCRFIPIEENVAERKEGYQKNPLTKAKQSQIALARPRQACPHCGKTAPKPLFVRWHGDKCKTQHQHRS